MEIFVFGSNLAGRHGAGSALEAKLKHGAFYGKGVGFQGNSYALPTKDKNLKTLPLDDIRKYIEDFLYFAEENPDYTFNVVEIGCGLAGYSPDQIAPLFVRPNVNLPRNINLPESFRKVIDAL
jgi:hypothetical protein